MSLHPAGAGLMIHGAMELKKHTNHLDTNTTS